MILNNGQNMVQPSSGRSGGGVLNRLWDVYSRNQNLAQITHSVEEATRGIDERNTNATGQLLRLMRIGQMTHGETHPDTIQEGLPNEGKPHPLAGQSTGDLKGTPVHPMFAHHMNEAGLRNAYGFGFGSQYKPKRGEVTENKETETKTPKPTRKPTPTPTGKKKRRK